MNIHGGLSGPKSLVIGMPNIETNAVPELVGGLGLYARVSFRDQKDDLERQVARLSAWAAEVSSGMNGLRST
ncbi:hypothetical protein E1288_42120 [Saccharopolyspora elongata]|uniref:Resolvase/invertase-type recombinase catalytic domain-containing protein n=1 Tax=Saccharopolyspora elongata TaxID=2530387 RepID=A0A4R4XYX1_9PSEU|nr:hypothetical protein E1288_42120 [Saccharopolyspora elongata]